MRHNPQARRMRGGRNNNGHSHNNQNGQRRSFQNKNRVFDSNGPDVRIRGTAFQIVEKYAALAKDASATGDWVLAESYLQHAEHYQRMISEWNVEEAQEQNSFDDDAIPFDRFSPMPAGTGPQPVQQQQQQPQSNGNTNAVEDLGLPSSIIGGARKTEMAEA